MANHILVPFDGSPSSRNALTFARGLCAERDGWRITVLSVEEEPVYYGEIALYMPPKEANAVALAAARRCLEGAREVVGPDVGTTQFEAKVGLVAETIVETAEQTGAAWIVMGTRGLGRLGGLLMGSIATKVVAHTTLPVTLVR